MASSACEILSIHFPNPEEQPLSSDDFNPVPSDISYRNECSDSIRALSIIEDESAANGFLYVPDISESSRQCFDDSAARVPANISQITVLLEDDEQFDLVGIAPWISPDCSMDYLAAARRSRTRAMFFYIPDSGSQQPPAVSDPVWDADDGGRWKSENNFPVYAVSGAMGAELIDQMVAYLGDVDKVPFGDEAIQEFGPGFVKLFAQLETGFTAEMPELWVFVLVVLSVIGLIVAGTSAFMHFVQYRRRHLLRRRIVTGEADLETIGISRFTVPQNILDKMPTHVYNSSSSSEFAEKSESGENPNASTQQAMETQMELKEKEACNLNSGFNPTISSLQKTGRSCIPIYSQPTCAICLDDFEVDVTTVRELPCNHIFHPDCIDSFLKDISSLCPMCKKSVLPTGYCPTRITNVMVRRERLARRYRQRHGESLGEAGGNSNSSNGHGSGQSIISFASTTPTMEVVSLPSPRQPYPLHIRSRLSTTIRPLGNLISHHSFPRRSTMPSNVNEALPGSSDHHPHPISHTQAASDERSSDATSLSPPPPPPTGASNRQAWTTQRARALLGRSVIGGPNGQSHISGVRNVATGDNEEEEARMPRWRKVLTAVFPGFT